MSAIAASPARDKEHTAAQRTCCTALHLPDIFLPQYVIFFLLPTHAFGQTNPLKIIVLHFPLFQPSVGVLLVLEALYEFASLHDTRVYHLHNTELRELLVLY